MPTVNVEFGAEQFIGTASICTSDKKVWRVVVALCAAKDSREDILSQALDAISKLENMAENGAAYTPDRSLGFGSDNAATIADKILGRTTTVGETRKYFAKIAN